jgi:hypothetical protein
MCKELLGNEHKSNLMYYFMISGKYSPCVWSKFSGSRKYVDWVVRENWVALSQAYFLSELS